MIHRIPSGTRDVLPDEMRELRAITDALRGVFERHGYGEVYTPTIEEFGFAGTVSRYWARFIATGDPNGGGATYWPPYNLASETYINFGAKTSTGDAWRNADCDFWDATVPVPYVYRQ